MSAAAAVTFFADAGAQGKHEEALSAGALAVRIHAATAATKNALPWLKLARFGDRRSDKGSLRHNDNLLACTGIEADYDAGRVAFQTVVDHLRNVSINAIAYTSPSYAPAFPKWRVLCPFSQELPPDQRARMLGRLAGVLAGIGAELAGESWTLSQAYFFGSVNGNPAHQVALLEGTPIDLRDDLDAGAVGKPNSPGAGAGNGKAGAAERFPGTPPPVASVSALYGTASAVITDLRLNGLLESLLDHLRRAPEKQKHHTLLRTARTIGGYAHLLGMGDDQLVALMLEVLPSTVADWKNAEKTAYDGLAHGRRQPLELEDRPLPGFGASGSAPQPDSSAAAAEGEVWDEIPNIRPKAKPASAIDPAALWDPWEDPPPPEWPNQILPQQFEATLADVSIRDGVDFGVLCMTVIAAASAAAPKNARFVPYTTSDWQVPPIIWCMLIGESGLRKTLLDTVVFGAIHAIQAAAWSDHRRESRAWKRTAKDQRGDKPEEPHSLIVNDYTPEALHEILGRTSRGTAVVKDELAGFFDFSRYGGAVNHGNRAFFLSAYDDKACPVHRIGRDSIYIEHTGASVFGAIQPDKYAQLSGLESDGLLQRIAPIRVKETAVSRPIPVHGLDLIHQAIDRLCRRAGGSCLSTRDGEEMIRRTEADAKRFASITDYGPGWKGFCLKAHGTHARLALILHILENPDEPVIPAETVHRAARLTRYLLQHARDFYSLIPDGRIELLRNIAGWLLTKKPDGDVGGERIVANQVASSVWSCRSLTSKGIAEVLDPFVTGGWLEPESEYPNNRAWLFNPAIRAIFREREAEERERRKRIRETIRALGEPAP
jgi:hypothetical protein